MAFIGIITSKKNEDILISSLTRYTNNFKTKLNMIIINESNIENIKNIKFDTIIMNEKNSLIHEKQLLLKQILSKTDFLILNSDIYNNIRILDKLKLNIITFGLNLKATVTASSIENDMISICVQRAFKNSFGNIIESGESSFSSHNLDTYRAIIAYILSLLYL